MKSLIHRSKPKQKKLFAVLSSLTLLSSIGITQAVPAIQYKGYRPPRGTIMMMAGNYVSGWADGLVSLYNTPTSMIYTDGQFEGSGSDSGIASLGFGYRQGDSHDNIWGGYLFVDRARSGAEKYYTMLGPGIEFLGSHWTARLNGYFSLEKNRHLDRSGYADDFGNFSFVKFTGHTELDRMAYDYESLDYGGDFTVSYRQGRWQGSLSPYVFRLKSNPDMVGAKVKLRYQVNSKLATFVADGYDNDNHNRVIAGISFSFGHGSDQNGSFESRMMSPVYRNLDVNTTANGLPVSTYTQYSGSNSVENQNIYFFNNSGNLNTSNNNLQAGVEDGTYEHPYTNLSQIPNAPSNAKIWVEGGTGSSYTSNEPVNLSGTQQLEGRTDSFKEAATAASAQPILQINTDTGVAITDNNSVKDVTIKGNGTAGGPGIVVESGGDGGTAEIDNVNIGSTNAAESFSSGISVDGGRANITDSTIRATVTDPGQDATGLEVQNGAVVTATNSNFYANSVGQFGGTTTGVTVRDSSQFTMSGGVASGTSSNSDSGGVFATTGTNTVDISNATLSGNASGNNSAAFGLRAASNGTFTISDSSLTATNTSTDGAAFGAFIGEKPNAAPTATFTNDSFTATAVNGVAIGVNAVAGVATITNGTFSFSSTNPISANTREDGGTIIIN